MRVDLQSIAYPEILDALTEAVLVADGSGRIVYGNSAVERLLGWGAGELTGKPLTAVVPPQMRGRHAAGFQRYQATRVPRILGRGVRAPALRRNGTELRVELTLSTFVTEGEEWFVATFRDQSPRAESDAEGGPPPLAALARAAAELASVADPERLPQKAVELLSNHFGAAVARVWRYDAARNTLHQPARVRLRGAPPEALRPDIDVERDTLLIAEVARARRPFLKNGLADDPQFDPAWIARERLAAVAALPLAYGGELHGVLAYFARTPLTHERLQELELFCALLAAALNEGRRARTAAERDGLALQTATLREVQRGLRSGRPAGEIVEGILERAVEALELDGGLLLLPDSRQEGFTVAACVGYKSPIVGYGVTAGAGLTHEIAAREATTAVASYPSYPKALPPLRQRGVQAVLGAPVFVGRRLAAVLKLETKKRGRVFAEADHTAIETFAACASLALGGG